MVNFARLLNAGAKNRDLRVKLNQTYAAGGLELDTPVPNNSAEKLLTSRSIR
jgi:hypothetical protein